MTSVRTTQDGSSSGQTGRFTPGQADALNTPSAGASTLVTGLPSTTVNYNPGRPPFIWMTGGGTAANADPANVGMDRILDYLCENRGYSICQPNVPWLLGNDDALDRIDDAVAWARANLGATDDPPILMGVSNGWVCAIVYARQLPVSGVAGMLTPCGSVDWYLATAPGSQGDFLGVIERIEDAWGVSWPALPPARWSPFDDVANYPVGLKVHMQYSCCDPLIVGTQMAFGAMIRAEMHNVGGTGHLGAFDGTAATEPIDNVDEVALADFIDSLWTP